MCYIEGGEGVSTLRRLSRRRKKWDLSPVLLTLRSKGLGGAWEHEGRRSDLATEGQRLLKVQKRAEAHVVARDRASDALRCPKERPSHLQPGKQNKKRAARKKAPTIFGSCSARLGYPPAAKDRGDAKGRNPRPTCKHSFRLHPLRGRQEGGRMEGSRHLTGRKL